MRTKLRDHLRLSLREVSFLATIAALVAGLVAQHRMAQRQLADAASQLQQERRERLQAYDTWVAELLLDLSEFYETEIDGVPIRGSLKIVFPEQGYSLLLRPYAERECYIEVIDLEVPPEVFAAGIRFVLLKMWPHELRWSVDNYVEEFTAKYEELQQQRLRFLYEKFEPGASFGGRVLQATIRAENRRHPWLAMSLAMPAEK